MQDNSPHAVIFTANPLGMWHLDLQRHTPSFGNMVKLQTVSDILTVALSVESLRQIFRLIEPSQ